MDSADRIEELLAENELLKIQLADLDLSIKNKDSEINFLNDSMETAASLQSRIDMNLTETVQLNYNMAEALQKNAGTELRNEALENNLLIEIREKHRQEAAVKKLGSVKTELEIISGELDDAMPLYTRIVELEGALAETRSALSGLEIENSDMKHELAALRELIVVLKNRKFE